MASSALNGYITVWKGVFLTIGELSYFGLFYYYIISKDNSYRVQRMEMVRLQWNNGVSGKYNTSKYYRIYCTG